MVYLFCFSDNIYDLDSRSRQFLPLYTSVPASPVRASPDGTHTPIISGQTFLSTSAAERLLTLHTLPPFTHCTYHATDSGLRPLRVRLGLGSAVALNTLDRDFSLCLAFIQRHSSIRILRYEGHNSVPF